MRCLGVAAIAIALLTAGCTSGPQTQYERQHQWIESIDERFAAQRDGASIASRINFRFGTVRIEMPAGASSEWTEVEADLRAAIDALDQSPFDQFEINITFAADYWLWWDLVDRDDIETAVAATEVWYQLRDSLTDDAWISGDTMRLQLQSTGDAVAERSAIIEKLEAAGIDTDNSSIIVLSD